MEVIKKIIGFTISKFEINHDDVDIFNVGLKISIKFVNNLYFYFWGIGDVDKCFINSMYTLSFPIHDSLQDTNVLISFDNDMAVIENDWLGSIPVFYNTRLNIVSTLMNKVMSNERNLHPEGFNNYLEFGYSAFEQTPIENVKFMRYFSKLTVNSKGITVKYKDDIIINNKLLTENEIFKLIEKKVNNVTTSYDGCKVILPLSGGNDSRVIANSIHDKTKVRAFTYGISQDQSKSFEVINAKKIAEVLGIKWRQIKLGHFNRYMKEWYYLFSCSTHLHGMYHIEFYKKISKHISKTDNTILFSGIIGDILAGKISYPLVANKSCINEIAYAGGFKVDPKKSKLNSDELNRDLWFDQVSDKINYRNLKPIYVARLHIILLSYLIRIPEYMGIASYSPYTNMQIALGMCSLHELKRNNRRWQEIYFERNNIKTDIIKDKEAYSNSLDLQGLLNEKLIGLNIPVLEKYLDKHYLADVNKKINSKHNIADMLFSLSYPLIIRVLKQAGFIDKSSALGAYYTLKPIEATLINKFKK